MRKWLRRIRGAIGMGLIWALAWFGAGVALLFVVGFGAADVPFPLAFGAFGFVAGAAFSLVLGFVEGGRRFEQLRLPRFAALGALGGLLLCALFVLAAAVAGELTPMENMVGLAGVFAVAGGASAAGSLVLARSASASRLRQTDSEAGLPGSRAEERSLPGGRA